LQASKPDINVATKPILNVTPPISISLLLVLLNIFLNFLIVSYEAKSSLHFQLLSGAQNDCKLSRFWLQYAKDSAWKSWQQLCTPYILIKVLTGE